VHIRPVEAELFHAEGQTEAGRQTDRFCFLDRAFSIMKTKNKPTKCTN